ncbi:MAG: PQQ-dependent catabolism-associated CXXCW motif protein [Filomicrobium sp.]
MQLKRYLAAPAMALFALLLAAPNPTLAEEEFAPEPDTYRMDTYRAPVPKTLKGGRVIDTEAAEALMEKGDAVFIDVYPQAPKPPNLPKTTVWRTPRHNTIKGAVWLPNVGYGVLNPNFEKYFRTGLEKFSGDDKAKTLVFFCLRNCWMSWNAAKRALEWGHTNVVWYPDGTDGWKEWNLPTEMRTPEE